MALVFELAFECKSARLLTVATPNLLYRHLPPFVGPNHPNQRLDSTGMVPARQHRVTLIVLIPAISGDEQNACLTLLLLALSQPHAGTPAVLVDELDPGRF